MGIRELLKFRLKRGLGVLSLEEKLEEYNLQIQKQLQEIKTSVKDLPTKQPEKTPDSLNPFIEQIRNALELPQIRDQILHEVHYVNHNLYLHLQEALRLRNLYYRDIMLVLDRLAQFIPTAFVELETEYPIAIDSDDHKYPWGTANDNTRSPQFVHRCETLFKKPLNFMDLGCSGGGLVLDFILRGHRAIGLEGSDFSSRSQRAEWRLLKNNLLTCDITKPFYLRDKTTSKVMQFDVISAWEVMEHIADKDLPQLFNNIMLHLSNGGIFIGSIATVSDGNSQTGAVYHQTIESQQWWRDRFRKLGMQFIDDHPFTFYDFCRGTGNGPIDENYLQHPDIGFHFVARKLV